MGIALENMEGRPLFANPALCAMLGLSEEEICRKHCVDFSPREDADKDWALFEQLRAGLLSHYTLEKRFFRSDGSLFRGRLRISLLNSSPFPLVVAMVEEIAEEKNELVESQANLQRLVSHLLREQQEERTRVARELRDGVNDRLMLLTATLDRLQDGLPGAAAEIRSKLGETREQLLHISNNVSALSHGLHSWKLDYLGLAKAAASLCTDLSERERVEIAFVCGDIPQELSEEVSVCVYRLLQDALTIAIRNSDSRKFQVSLDAGSDELRLEVSDPGNGFDPEQVMTEGAISLSGMNERLKLVDGELMIDLQLEGSTLIARVPLLPGT